MNIFKKKTIKQVEITGPLNEQSSDEDIEKALKSDALTRKKFYSNFCWYHEGLISRNAAESKLRGYRAELKLVNLKNNFTGKENKSKHKKLPNDKKDNSVSENKVVYLVRPNVTCSGEYILSYLTKDDKCYHYKIVLQPKGLYSLDTIASDRDELEQFSGINNIVEALSRENNLINEILEVPLPQGLPPPSGSISHGYTNVLHEAISNNHCNVALKIIANKELMPGVDDRDRRGSTALHLACKYGKQAIVEALLELGASVSAVDSNYSCALHIACINNFPGIVTVLLEKGNADPQMRSNSTGDVALHIAAERGYVECVKALLEANPVTGIRNFALKTPTELAQESGHTQCVNAIDNYKPPPAITQRAQWFHENIDRQHAIELLENHSSRDGLFLVRPSHSDAQKYVLNVCFRQKKKSYVIESLVGGRVFCINNGPLLLSLEHLVEYYSQYRDGLICKLNYALAPGGMISQIRHHSAKAAPLDLPPRDRPPAATEPMVLKRSNLEIGLELGQGEYGSVLQGTWLAPSGQRVPVAIKTLNREHTSGKEGFLREAQVMVGLDHPCIVKLIGVCQAESFMLVQELLPMGSLLDFLLDYPEKIDMDYDQQIWSTQVAYGMVYLEEKCLVHRDLAARNILLSGKSQVKIGDFGLSRAVGANDYYRAIHGGKWPVKWYAPESINYGTFSSASDVWSFGVTMWEMYSLGEQPYAEKNGSQVIQMLERGGRLECPAMCPPTIFKVMLDCWKYKATERPTFVQLYDKISRIRQSYENITPVRASVA